jgi:hypothetical protein
MGTGITEINDLFMLMQRDYRLLAIYKESAAGFNTYLEGWLLFSIDEFQDICDQDLTYDTTTQSFSQTLSRRNKLVLAQIMTKYWLTQEVQDVLQMNVNLQDHDFKHYAESQNLKEKKDMLITKKEEISQLLIDYSYRNINWDAWETQVFRSS